VEGSMLVIVGLVAIAGLSFVFVKSRKQAAKSS
jgi:LPXTG-motif cell wall-anchored protein